MDNNKRIWKTYLPNNLCEQVDLLLESGSTGYKTRDDFIKDALYNHLKDVSFENNRSNKSIPSQTFDDQNSKYEDLIYLKFLDEFKNLETNNNNAVNIDLQSFSLPSGREFPSFFMHYNIAKCLVEENKGEIKSIKKEILPNAWIIREKAKLKELNYPTLTEHKISTGFPSSKEKKVNSEKIFWDTNFKELVYRGYLSTDYTYVSLTKSGLGLLEIIDGIKLEYPYELSFTKKYLTFMQQRNDMTFQIYNYIVNLLTTPKTRNELIDEISNDNFVKTYMSQKIKVENWLNAYIGRSRELGLIDVKLIDKKYQLTSEFVQKKKLFENIFDGKFKNSEIVRGEK